MRPRFSSPLFPWCAIKCVFVWVGVVRADEPVVSDRAVSLDCRTPLPPPSISSINLMRLLNNPLTLMLRHLDGKMHGTLF